MTELYLNQKRVFFGNMQKLKVTRENPLLTDSGSYTLNIELPMDFKENIEVLGNLHRIDVSKSYSTFDAILICDNHTILNGTAVVTEVDEKTVKVQLLSGNSEVKFWDRAEKKYIDEIDYNTISEVDIVEQWISDHRYNGPWCTLESEKNKYRGEKRFVFMRIYDDSNDVLMNEGYSYETIGYNTNNPKGESIIFKHQCVHPRLLYVAKVIINSFGYSWNENELSETLASNIYIASARTTLKIADVLPHWTVKEFIQEFQNFFNCTIVFDDINKVATAYPNSYMGDTVDITEDIVDEFNAEIVSDEDVEINIGSSNIKYAERGGTDIDMVNEEILDAYENINYSSAQDAYNAFSTLSEDEKKIKVFASPQGKYVYDGSSFVKIDHFGKYVRNENNADDNFELRITPCRTRKEYALMTSDPNKYGTNYKGYVTDLVISNEYVAPENKSVWESIQDEDVDSGTDKENIMEIFLLDEKRITCKAVIAADTGSDHWVTTQDSFELWCPLPFTENGFHMTEAQKGQHEDWSLALSNCACSKFHGSLFADGVKQNRNVTLAISWLSKTLYKVTSIFVIRGKKYRCKKMEISFDDESMDRLVKGYFVEIIS